MIVSILVIQKAEEKRAKIALVSVEGCEEMQPLRFFFGGGD